MLRHILTMVTSRFFLLQTRLLLVYYCCIASFAIVVAVQTSDVSTDESALLSLKASITIEGQNMIFTDWSTNNICNWAGVTCGASHRRVEVLDLSYFGLSGTIPAELGNLSFLVDLDFTNNSFQGPLPQELSRLHRLKFLSFGLNNFGGTIPSWFGSLSKLQTLDLYGNQFSGSMPAAIFNLSALQVIDLKNNNLSGTIPHGVGDLPNLQILSLMGNNLNGLVPSTIFNMSTIRVISISSNNLSGSFPTNIGLGFPNIQEFYASSNKLSGVIPKSISNASKLTGLDLGGNSFYGSIPSSLCASPNLERLVLESNNLTIDKFTPEVNILSCLATLTKLRKLWLSDNPLNAMLPFSLGNLSTSLEYMILRNCNMSGKIPNDIGNLSSLIFLDFGLNELSGSIPTTIGRLQKLQVFNLSNNILQGYVPDELCQLKNLGDLLLQGNQLSGSIPSCLGDLNASLRILSLGSNLLTSTIPSTLWRLTYILHLDLSSNSLSGLLSEELGNLKVVTDIYLSNNHFSGSIPISIGFRTDLVILNLANNSLEGSIPDTFIGCPSLEFLDLSKNNLSGVIPKSLQSLLYLRYLNLSINRLHGEIPEGGAFEHLSYESIFSNGELCGSPHLQVPLCPSSTRSTPLCQNRCITILKCIIPGIPLAILIVAFIWRLILHRKRNAKAAKVTTLLPPQPLWRRVSYKELRRATYGFAETNLLGTGGLGSVYRGTLSDGILVAIKVFNVQLEEALTSFDMECKMLSTIRHRNLIKIISCCIDIDFRALVLGYMPNGSLEKWLYSDNFSLSILQRLNILIDVALALEYLHHGYETTIVHCDLKPSNILLDDDMVAHVADFGIAKLLGGGGSMSQTTTLATIGYMAPEYGMGGIVSRRGDVYSFGIILMETFTKRKPTDDMFVGQMNLKQWVANSLLSDAIVEVVDSNLIGTQEEDEDFVSKRYCLSCIMNLAMACCEESPENRMNIQDALSTLNKIKKKFLKDTAGGMLPNVLLFSRRSIEEFYSIFHGF
ncbi:putative protein kinase RLK-Pelle-LRR-XII-1 family [Rosa chinensis]|uniref:non-specific serine/threonine protein kinase n=1 Tax=Rosa chinensis TaxID=74649 RepID=A0A2P6QTC9_ROSCH|nr:putative protein kinase RLK-Pelle-LRR-XII-1 family [Rosa chinensis]